MKDVRTANPPLRSHRTGPRTHLLHSRTNSAVLPAVLPVLQHSLVSDRTDVRRMLSTQTQAVWWMVQRSNKDPTEPGLQHKSLYKPVRPDGLHRTASCIWATFCLCSLLPKVQKMFLIWFNLMLRRKRSCRQSDLLVVLGSVGAVDESGVWFTTHSWHHDIIVFNLRCSSFWFRVVATGRTSVDAALGRTVRSVCGPRVDPPVSIIHHQHLVLKLHCFMTKQEVLLLFHMKNKGKKCWKFKRHFYLLRFCREASRSAELYNQL